MSEPPLYCRLPNDWWVDPSQCWFEWQGLVSGILAVAAAFFSILYFRRQIAQTSELHQNELSRRHAAVRSVVPIALASINDFCENVTEQIAVAIEDRQDDFVAAFDAAASKRSDQKRFQPIQIPSDVIATMQLFVETLTDKREVKHVAELLSSLQILQSRFNSFDLSQFGVLSSLHSLLIDVAKVSLLTDTIYNYGRFVDDNSFAMIDGRQIQKSWDEILGKAQGLVFRRRIPDLFFPELHKLIDSYKKNGVSPWNEKFGDR